MSPFGHAMGFVDDGKVHVLVGGRFSQVPTELFDLESLGSDEHEERLPARDCLLDRRFRSTLLVVPEWSPETRSIPESSSRRT